MTAHSPDETAAVTAGKCSVCRTRMVRGQAFCPNFLNHRATIREA